jgi:DNA-binding protein H-NS
MKQSDLESMPTDELWMLHGKIIAKLAAKISAEKEVLENRLKLLTKVRVHQTIRMPKRRPYPAVFPKFRNPEEPSEAWAGRGRQPPWLTAQLRSGKQIDDFRIKSVAA